MKTIPLVQIEKLTLREFVMRVNSLVESENVGKKKYKISQRKLHWIYLIETNNLTCPVTGKVVNYCSYDRQDHKNPKTAPTFHYNFYSEDGELFTIDHKHPISKGGSRRAYDNIQPMTLEENIKKGNNLIYL